MSIFLQKYSIIIMIETNVCERQATTSDFYIIFNLWQFYKFAPFILSTKTLHYLSSVFSRKTCQSYQSIQHHIVNIICRVIWTQDNYKIGTFPDKELLTLKVTTLVIKRDLNFIYICMWGTFLSFNNEEVVSVI